MEDLALINWENVSGFHRSGQAIKTLLLDLQENLSKRSLRQLQDELWHQGSISRAAIVICPILISVLENERASIQFRKDLITMIAVILNDAIEVRDQIFPNKLLVDAIREEKATFYRLLLDKDLHIRAWASLIVSKLEADFELILSPMIVQEKEPVVISTLLWILRQYNQPAILRCAQTFLNSKFFACKFSSAITLALIADNPPNAITNILMAPLMGEKESYVIDDPDRFPPSLLFSIEDWILCAIGKLDIIQQEEILARIAIEIEAMPPQQGLELLELGLKLLNNQKTSQSNLSSQKQFLNAIVKTEGLWKQPFILVTALHLNAFGFPKERQELALFTE